MITMFIMSAKCHAVHHVNKNCLLTKKINQKPKSILKKITQYVPNLNSDKMQNLI